MPTPTERSLETLARSQDEAAVTLLERALKREDRIGVEAVSVIGRCGGRRIKFEVVRRVDDLSTAQKDAVSASVANYADAVSHAIDGRVDSDRMAALTWITTVDDFTPFATLIGRLPTAPEAELPRLMETLETLTDRIFDFLTGRGTRAVADAATHREAMFEAIMNSLETLDSQPAPDRILEWGLILSDAQQNDASKLLAKLDEHGARQVNESLMTSVHPGILRVPTDLMKRSFPFDIAFDVFRERSDDPFVHELLRSFPEELSQNQTQNLKLVDSLPWLTGDVEEIERIPASLHVGLVRLLEAVGLDDNVKQNVLRWLLLNGDRAAREAASNQFWRLDKSESHQILRASLEDEDVEVRAWATSQLREQEVPDAFRLLIIRLDSKVVPVRDAAREQLHDLDLRRALMMLELTPEKVTPALGLLLKKVDPDICIALRRELASPIRFKRVNAVRIAGALGFAQEVVSGIASLLEDHDTLVRRTAVDALGHLPSRDALNALMKATEDKSPRVRGAAVQALQQLRSLATVDPTVASTDTEVVEPDAETVEAAEALSKLTPGSEHDKISHPNQLINA